MDLDEWDVGTPNPGALKAMDAIVQEYKAKRDEYDDEKKKLSKLWEEVDKLQMKAVAALKAAGKSKWQVDGLGTFSIVTKYQITTPKTIEEKVELFDYIEKKYGKEVLEGMLSIHSGTLNSFYNQEFENSDSDEKLTFSLPGVGAPTAREEARFTKARK